jgi:prolyl-tRNA synthetase
VRREVRSYRDLPMNLYQIQTKFRDEIRPRFGVMRAREFLMKDAYSFDVNEEASADSYRVMQEAYRAVFRRLGLRFSVVEAQSGAIGGSFSHEFMVLAETGEDAIVSCGACDYAANVEKAELAPAGGGASEPAAERALADTPGAHTVEEVAAFLKVEPRQVAKTLIYLADGRPVAAMVRGDRSLNEAKLAGITGAGQLALAGPAAIRELTGAPVGFSGPVGLDLPVYADHELLREPELVVGANQADAHFTGVHLGRDVPGARAADLREIAPGDPCPRCGGKLAFGRGIEVGHTFRLGTKYSEALGATYLDAEGQSRPVVMGCYGIGVSRIVAAAIEQGFDGAGIIFPLPIAPFSVLVAPLAAEGEPAEVAERIHRGLERAGVDALLDDRDLRPGVKFKDADLIGVPLRVVVGAKGLKNGQVELKRRADGEVEMLPVDQAVERLAEEANQGGAQRV